VANVGEDGDENENGQYQYQLINERLFQEFAYTLCLIIPVNPEIYPNKWTYLRTEFLYDKVQTVSVTNSSPLRLFGDKILNIMRNI
jgi:hypothetical protein